LNINLKNIEILIVIEIGFEIGLKLD